ncbi:MAG: kelch repeat-containing protein [Bacteroidota bacterium]
MKLAKFYPLFLLFALFAVACSSDNSSDSNEPLVSQDPVDTPGQIELSIGGFSGFGDTPFSLVILRENGTEAQRFDGITQLPQNISLDDGNYQVVLESLRPEVITVNTNLFGGASSMFTVVKNQVENIVISVAKEPFKGWVLVPDVPVAARRGASSFLLNGNIYVGFGFDEDNMLLKDWWRYSIATNEWTQLPDFPDLRRAFMTSFSIDSVGYITLGIVEDEVFLDLRTTELWSFDAQTEQWNQEEDFTSIWRSGPVAMVIGNNAYVGTGFDNGAVVTLSDFYELNGDNKLWSNSSDFTGPPTYGFGTFTLGDQGHLLAGTVNGDVRTNQHYVFDSQSQIWEPLSDLPGDARLEAVCFTVNDIGYYGLGSITNNQPGTDFWRYNTEQDSWTEVSSFPGESRFSPVWGSNNEVGYCGFGRGRFGVFNDLYLYYPED